MVLYNNGTTPHLITLTTSTGASLTRTHCEWPLDVLEVGWEEEGALH